MRFHYTIETGYIGSEGNEYLDDEYDTYTDLEEASRAYLAISPRELEDLMRDDEYAGDMQWAFKKLSIERYDDDDPDDYVQETVVALLDTSSPEDDSDADVRQIMSLIEDAIEESFGEFE